MSDEKFKLTEEELEMASEALDRIPLPRKLSKRAAEVGKGLFVFGYRTPDGYESTCIELADMDRINQITDIIWPKEEEDEG